MEKLHWCDGSGRINLYMTLEQAKSVAHSGSCDNDVGELRQLPEVAQQLKEIDTEVLKKALREYGCWDEGELASHEENLDRIVWIAGGDIADGQSSDA